ncbi:hypothetical protein C4564_02305 [Candidatus Microgenomates bacterium]|nr:MAG: hypothetical protein C4564_02305 [Candidatus Microgenomates bacterium]
MTPERLVQLSYLEEGTTDVRPELRDNNPREEYRESETDLTQQLKAAVQASGKRSVVSFVAASAPKD